MTRWTVAAPTALDFDEVTKLNVRLIGGTVAVLASGDQPGLAVTELSGRPLQVTHENGALTVSYDSLSWEGLLGLLPRLEDALDALGPEVAVPSQATPVNLEGLLGLLKPRKDSATVTITVPADCPVKVGVLSASAVVAGLHAGAVVRGMSGDITLDGVSGDISAETMSGEVAGCGLDGTIQLKSMSGGLTLADAAVDSLMMHTMSGPITADVALRSRGSESSVHVNTMSGEVTLRLPADSDASVHLHSGSGRVSTEFETLRAVKVPASHTLSGNVGAGTGHVFVTTISGAVTLLRGTPVGMESKTQ